MRKLIFLLALLFPVLAYAQDRIELGYQTTKRGIVWYRLAPPTHAPAWKLSRDTNAVQWVDRSTGLQYDWDYSDTLWRTHGTYTTTNPPLPSQTSGLATIDNRQANWLKNNQLHYYSHVDTAWVPYGRFFVLSTAPTNIASSISQGAAKYTTSLWQDLDDYQVYYWNGSAWTAISAAAYTNEQAQDAVFNAILEGAGIDVAYNDGANTFTITNTGDTDATDDLTTSTVFGDPFGSDVTGLWDNLQIKPDAVGSLEINSSAVGTSEVANNSLTATDLAVNVVSSLDSVSADGGNIDLIPGTGISITPNDGANTITINNTGIITEVDGSITNENLALSDGTDSENLGGQTLNVAGSGGITTDYVPGTNTLTIGGAGITSNVAEVADSTAFRAFTATANMVIMRDSLRGGKFRRCYTCTADQYMTFTDASGRKWSRFDYESINPHWFGARGDSIHDDRPAMQAAVLEAGRAKGIVKIESGKYLMKTYSVDIGGGLLPDLTILPIVTHYAIKPTSGVSIVGTGRDSVTLINGTGGTLRMFRIMHQRDINIQNIGIDMQLHLGNIAIAADSSENIEVSNCKIFNTSWTVYGKITTDLRVKNNILRNKRISTAASGNVVEMQGIQGLVISQNVIEADFAQVAANPGGAPQAIEIWTTFDDQSSERIRVEGNLIRHTKTGVGCQACIDAIIQNNIIDSIAQNGITFVASEQGINVTPSNSVTVQGNTIQNFGLDPVNGGNGIYLQEGNEDIKILFNTIRNSADDALGQGMGIVIQSPPASRNVQIKNNLIENVHRNGMFIADGVLFDIQQNTINKYSITADQDGINIFSLDSSVIAGNTIKENRAVKTGQFGIHAQVAVTNCNILNNVIDANVLGVYSPARGTNTYFNNTNQLWTITNDPSSTNRAGLVLGSGSTANRDPTPMEGTVRGNTDSTAFEGYVNGAWQTFLNNSALSGTISGDGVTNYFSKFLGSTTIDSSMLYQNGGDVELRVAGVPSFRLKSNGNYETETANAVAATQRLSWKSTYRVFNQLRSVSVDGFNGLLEAWTTSDPSAAGETGLVKGWSLSKAGLQVPLGIYTENGASDGTGTKTPKGVTGANWSFLEVPQMVDAAQGGAYLKFPYMNAGSNGSRNWLGAEYNDDYGQSLTWYIGRTGDVTYTANQSLRAYWGMETASASGIVSNNFMGRVNINPSSYNVAATEALDVTGNIKASSLTSAGNRLAGATSAGVLYPTTIDPASLVSGSGTSNYLPKFSSASALDNSLLYQDGTSIELRTAGVPAFRVKSNGDFETETANAVAATHRTSWKSTYRVFNQLRSVSVDGFNGLLEAWTTSDPSAAGETGLTKGWSLASTGMQIPVGIYTERGASDATGTKIPFGVTPSNWSYLDIPKQLSSDQGGGYIRFPYMNAGLNASRNWLGAEYDDNYGQSLTWYIGRTDNIAYTENQSLRAYWGKETAGGSGIVSNNFMGRVYVNPSSYNLAASEALDIGAGNLRIRDLTTNGNVLTHNGDGVVASSTPASIVVAGGGLDNTDAQNLGLAGQSLTISGGTGVTLPVIALTSGVGISINSTAGNFTIDNIGDTDASNDLTTATSFSGDVSGLYNNLQLGANVVGTAEIAANSVLPADMQQVAGVSLMGRTSTVTGNWLDITASGGNQVPRTNSAGTTLGFGLLDPASFNPGTNGQSIVTAGGASVWGTPSVPISSLLAATGTNTINNADFTQTWNWNTATTQTGMLWTANTLTTGGIWQISTNNNSLNSTDGLLTVKNNGTSISGLLASFVANGNVAGAGMTITTFGRTGFGTVSPNRTVEISGELRVTDRSTDTATELWGGDGDGDLSGITVGSGLSLAGNTLSATGGGAPTSATYVTLTNDATLSAERVLTAGTNMKLTDGGANSTMTLAAASETFALPGDITPTAITGTVSDYAPTGLSTASVIRQDMSADATLTSLTGGSDGRIIVWYNISTLYTLTLVNSSGAGTATNRFTIANGNTSIRPGGSAQFQYDATTQRWRVNWIGTWAQASIVYEFTSAVSLSSITIPAGAKTCTAFLVGGGGGGASGEKRAAGTVRLGGGGGSGGGYASMTRLDAGDATVMYVTVGAGGAGGASQTTNSSAGNNGAAGTASTIHIGGTTASDLMLLAGGGTGAVAAGGIGGSVTNLISEAIALQGSTASATGGNAPAPSAPQSGGGKSPGQGGAGGGINTGNTAGTFGAGGTGWFTTSPGGSTNGAAATAIGKGRHSGGGGAGGNGLAAGGTTGGAGVRGGGGGGGGAATDSTGNSGAGGAGGTGYGVVVFEF